MKTIVGLDLSLTSTGLACGDLRIAITTNLKGMERISEIANRLLQVVCDLNDPAVVIEGYSFSSRASHAHSAGELGGVVRYLLWRNGVPFVEVPPTNRAKFATGRGNASKAEVVSSVSARTGMVWSGKGADDMCDAFVLEEMGLAAQGRPRFGWPQAHLAALAKINWSPIL